MQSDIKLWPFRVVDKSNKPHVTVKVGKQDKQFTPEEISAMVLIKMKEIAESYLGQASAFAFAITLTLTRCISSAKVMTSSRVYATRR